MIAPAKVPCTRQYAKKWPVPSDRVANAVAASTRPAATSRQLEIEGDGSARSVLNQAANEIGANGRQLNAPASQPWPAPARKMKPRSCKAANNEATRYFMSPQGLTQVRAPRPEVLRSGHTASVSNLPVSQTSAEVRV
jgi:hypothetical protein